MLLAAIRMAGLAMTATQTATEAIVEMAMQTTTEAIVEMAMQTTAEAIAQTPAQTSAGTMIRESPILMGCGMRPRRIRRLC